MVSQSLNLLIIVYVIFGSLLFVFVVGLLFRKKKGTTSDIFRRLATRGPHDNALCDFNLYRHPERIFDFTSHVAKVDYFSELVKIMSFFPKISNSRMSSATNFVRHSSEYFS